ncbi:MAG TPA: hypothetical protein VHY30_06270 [Verrucomicrobiae bacterium]|jgi:hypothetical protein|nr:hypothetical protein [Verrucomicrobiae bacterium]
MVSLNPMIYVKIICPCGQKYAFDVLPVNNRMPSPVKCPVCRADGTAAANEILAQKTTGISPAPPVPMVPMVPSTPPAMKIPSVYDVPSVQIPMAAPAVNSPNFNNISDAEWRRRALEAEARMEQTQAALKAGLAPQLADFLKEAVVQGLAAQRAELLKAQQCAALEISELVHRLDELKAPMQDRLRSYEDRIAELEKDLAERNEENRELLKLKIEMMRRQLETERSSSRVDFN